MSSRQAVNQAVKEAYDAGLCVVPPREDGSKAPVGEWKRFQQARPSLDQLREFYREERHGLGTVGGSVSGELEILEFESEEIYRAFKAHADLAGLQPLVDKIESGYLEQAPRGGFHWLWRTIKAGGNRKLAMTADYETLIETRGAGGYCILAPSYGPIHPTGNPYTRVAGSFEGIVFVDADERAALFAVAESLDKAPKERDQRVWAPRENIDGGRPGDEFERQGDWAHDVLRPAGWTSVGLIGGQEYWRRPGKDRGHSAVLHLDSGIFVPFSSSTPFPVTEVGYGKFSAYAWLHHAGDFTAAASALKEQGYGKPREPKPKLWTPPEGIVPMRSLGTMQLPEIESLPLLGRDQLAIDGGSHLIYGKPKAGKTELLLRLLEEWQEAGLRALILSEEPLMFWKERLERLGRPWEFWDAAIADATGWGINVTLNILDDIDGFDVLIVDTLRNTVGYREGKADEDIPRVVIPLVVNARKKGQTLFCTWHARKMPGEQGDDVSGHHSLLAAFDRAIQLRALGGEGQERKRRIHVYGRLMDPSATTGLTYEWMPDGTFRVLDAESLLGKEATCASCGKAFTAERSSAKYCSNACRQSDFRSRNANDDS